MNSNFGQIQPLTAELAAIECLKMSHRLSWESDIYMLVCSFLIESYPAGDKDMHNNLKGFDFLAYSDCLHWSNSTLKKNIKKSISYLKIIQNILMSDFTC